MTDDFDLLAGVDEPRPLPPELRRRLQLTLTGEEPAVVALAGADGPRQLPAELADRLADAMTTDPGVAMPAPVRRRLERTLTARPAWSRGAAVAAALLFLVASAVVIGRGGPDRADDEVAGAPEVEATTAATDAPVFLEPEVEASPPAATTVAPPTRRAQETTPTTAAFTGRASGDAMAEAPAAAGAGAAATRAAPRVTVTPSTARRGEEVTARVEGFPAGTVRYTLKAPSGRVVLEGEGPVPEFRFTVPLVTENGRHVLTVEGGGQSAQASLDV